MRTAEDLRTMQKAPLSVKVLMTKQRIREWVREFGEDGVYVSFSGGKDSTVLLHIVREDYPGIKAVFCDTGLEFPEIKEFVKTFDNVDIIRPEMLFREVISVYGYPVISKSVANCIRGARLGQKSRINCLNGLNCDGSDAKSKFSKAKYKPLLDVDFRISEQCCDVMKKKPSHLYQKQTNKKPILGILAEESMLREKNWIKSGCNAFNDKQPKSAPLSFWVENDVLQYIKQNNIKIAKPYGDVVYDDNNEQYSFLDRSEDKLKTTGMSRTGCIFCGFGCHLEKQSRWLLLRESHPKLYNYCIGGGEYVNGIWQPSKSGLGMGHVFDQLNEVYGENFIRYK